jgi:S-adenosylmethionine decarboxylase
MDHKSPFLDHLLIEVFNVGYPIEKMEDVEDRLREFVSKCGLTVVKSAGHNFSPFGFTRVFILSESHIIFHSWPENNYLNIDLLSCKKLESYQKIRVIAKEIFNSKNIKMKKVKYE